jgi:hypothetical protein
LLIELAESVGNFSDVLSCGLVGRRLGVKDRELEVAARQLLDVLSDAVERAAKEDIEKAAKRGLGALRRLYVGFDPAKLTPDQKAWLEKQIAEAAKKEATE